MSVRVMRVQVPKQHWKMQIHLHKTIALVEDEKTKAVKQSLERN